MRRQFVFALVLAGVFAFGAIGCEPEPSSDCGDVCGRMVELYSTAMGGSAVRPPNGLYDNSYACYTCPDNDRNCYTDTKFCCPVNWANTAERLTPILEQYISTDFMSSNTQYSNDECRETCEFYTYSGSAPYYKSTTESFNFKECLNMSPGKPQTKEFYKEHLAVIGIYAATSAGKWVFKEFGDCLTNNSYWQNGICKNGQFAATNTGLLFTQSDLEKLNKSCSDCAQKQDPDAIKECEKGIKNSACMYYGVNAQNDNAVLSCWLLQSCRDELNAWIAGEERQ